LPLNCDVIRLGNYYPGPLLIITYLREHCLRAHTKSTNYCDTAHGVQAPYKITVLFGHAMPQIYMNPLLVYVCVQKELRICDIKKNAHTQ